MAFVEQIKLTNGYVLSHKLMSIHLHTSYTKVYRQGILCMCVHHVENTGILEFILVSGDEYQSTEELRMPV